MKNKYLISKLLLAYCSFVIACVVVIITFMVATSYTQLAIAILLYPLLVYFAFKIFPRKVRSLPSKNPVGTVQSPVRSMDEVEVKKEGLGISDIDKRVFLQLIGGAGISLLLFSLFNKRPGGIFPKSFSGSGETVSLQDIDGNKIGPAQSQPMDGYRISEIDEGESTFYGFINKDGAWFVMKEDPGTGSFRYATGESNFPGNWSNRENLKYDYYSNIF